MKLHNVMPNEATINANKAKYMPYAIYDDNHDIIGFQENVPPEALEAVRQNLDILQFCDDTSNYEWYENKAKQLGVWPLHPEEENLPPTVTAESASFGEASPTSFEKPSVPENATGNLENMPLLTVLLSLEALLEADNSDKALELVKKLLKVAQSTR